jgi:hypothetical protein
MPFDVNAASATISIRNSRTTMVIGNSFTTTVTVSSASPIGAWNFDLKYDTSKLRLTGSSFGGTYIVDTFKTTNQKTATYTFNFTAIANGDASIYIANASVIGMDEATMTLTKGSTKVKILTQAELEATYSKNNYLKTLSVEGYTLSPAFNKDTLAYTVSLPPETKEAKVIATVEDSRSDLEGATTVSLVDGDNIHKVVVTAQNGSERTYTINLNVEELDPIAVTINDNEFTVVRKKGAIECPNLFEDATITYNGEEIPGCFNEASTFNLMSLKNIEGISKFYIYDNDAFLPYQEVVLNRVVFYPMELPEDSKDDYKKRTLVINDAQMESLQNIKDLDFSIIYGKNIETGEESYYVYDAKEMTIQRYLEQDDNKDTLNRYFIMIIILAISTSLLLVSTGTLLYFKLKKRKKSQKAVEAIKKELL